MKMTKINVLAIFTLVIASLTGYSQTVEEGLKHLNAERYFAAGLVFDKVAIANPTVDNLFQLGRYYLSTPEAKENLDKAKAAFDKANELEKGSSSLANIGLGGVKLAQGDYAGAKALFASAVEKRKDAKNPDNFYRIAEMYTLFPWANDPAEAIINIDKALEIQEVKDNAEYFKVKADAYLIKNEGGDVMNALQNAERIKSFDMADIYSSMARVWLQGKNYKEAQEAIDNSIAADMKHAPAYKYQSSLYQTYQQWDQCAQAAKLYLEYSDGDCGAKLRYAQIAFNGKDFDNVLKTIKEIESCNENPIVHRLEGISQYELKNPELAIPPLEKYISVAESENIYGLDYGFLGRSYFELTDEANREANRAKGIELIEKAIAMEDSTFDYYTYLADAYKAENKFGPAVKFFKKAIANKKAPDAADYANLGLLQYSLRDYKGADSTFDDVVEAYKGSWPQAIAISARLKTLANPTDSLYSFAYRYQEYLDVLTDEQKEEGNADMTEALRYLAGKAFAIDKDIVKATEYLDQILKYDPSNESILNLKNQINGIVPEPADTDSTNIPAPVQANPEK
jgi:Tfp pilus assembly protein PilF